MSAVDAAASGGTSACLCQTSSTSPPRRVRAAAPAAAAAAAAARPASAPDRHPRSRNLDTPSARRHVTANTLPVRQRRGRLTSPPAPPPWYQPRRDLSSGKCTTSTGCRGPTYSRGHEQDRLVSREMGRRNLSTQLSSDVTGWVVRSNVPLRQKPEKPSSLGRGSRSDRSTARDGEYTSGSSTSRSSAAYWSSDVTSGSEADRKRGHPHGRSSPPA